MLMLPVVGYGYFLESPIAGKANDPRLEEGKETKAKGKT